MEDESGLRVSDELGITAQASSKLIHISKGSGGLNKIFEQAQVAQKLSGRMCFGVSLPGTGHTAYIFEIRTSNGEQWKVSRRYSEFLELDTKLRQVSYQKSATVMYLRFIF